MLDDLLMECFPPIRSISSLLCESFLEHLTSPGMVFSVMQAFRYEH